MTTIPSVKTVLEIHNAIALHYRFRWVMSPATREALLAALPDTFILVSPEEERLVGMPIRIDDTVNALYLEWVS